MEMKKRKCREKLDIGYITTSQDKKTKKKFCHYFVDDLSKSNDLITDFENLKKIKHKNISEYYKHGIVDDEYCITTEFTSSTLHKIIEKNVTIPNEKHFLLKITKQIISALLYLKKQNLLTYVSGFKDTMIAFDENLNIKLVNLHIPFIEMSYLSKTMNFSFRHLPPECMTPKRIKEREKESILVFSLGIILWQFVTCKIPWKNYGIFEIVTKYEERKTLEIPKTCLSKIIKLCLYYDIKKRPTLEELESMISNLEEKK